MDRTTDKFWEWGQLAAALAQYVTQRDADGFQALLADIDDPLTWRTVLASVCLSYESLLEHQVPAEAVVAECQHAILMFASLRDR